MSSSQNGGPSGAARKDSTKRRRTEERVEDPDENLFYIYPTASQSTGFALLGDGTLCAGMSSKLCTHPLLGPSLTSRELQENSSTFFDRVHLALEELRYKVERELVEKQEHHVGVGTYVEVGAPLEWMLEKCMSAVRLPDGSSALQLLQRLIDGHGIVAPGKMVTVRVVPLAAKWGQMDACVRGEFVRVHLDRIRAGELTFDGRVDPTKALHAEIQQEMCEKEDGHLLLGLLVFKEVKNALRFEDVESQEGGIQRLQYGVQRALNSTVGKFNMVWGGERETLAGRVVCEVLRQLSTAIGDVAHDQKSLRHCIKQFLAHHFCSGAAVGRDGQDSGSDPDAPVLSLIALCLDVMAESGSCKLRPFVTWACRECLCLRANRMQVSRLQVAQEALDEAVMVEGLDLLGVGGESEAGKVLNLAKAHFVAEVVADLAVREGARMPAERALMHAFEKLLAGITNLPGVFRD
uniref:Uncharacterized protein n=1 Tax=Chromera velia CCMP2878 TaxID=1169474 RepID=A0A0G4I0M4_9ALVE|eukprot:Cvel_9981.t1-p1 / transcript=Cvel_9981.t1 / gene=Cvel_9981 / organism=Chromera_velia_CCMP2878 / gene_product=hypothetical protein / transcript_product=hypothetical protein / location=Cvel_scaffold590:67238-68858(+) / protein_length=463 / sequence_SO=supercontig / SO=protein_coding / is_pseudo=false